MIRKICSTFFVVFLLLLINLLATTPALAANNYSVSNNVVYQNNTPIQLKGVNWFGMESHPSVYTFGGLHVRDFKDMIAQMKQVGFNSVRIPVCPATLDNLPTTAITFENGKNTELVGKKSLEVLDTVIAEMNRQQMYILLDHHRIDCQSIPQLWYSDSYSEAEWISDLVMMADRYKNTDYFMGIDLKNEPHGRATWGTGNAATDWNTAAEKAGAAVLATNPNVLIFVEGVQDNPSCTSTIGHWMGGNIEPIDCTPISTAKISANKLVLSPHVYGPDVYMQPYFNEGSFPVNLPSIWEQHFGQYVNKGFTIIPGEWGGKYGNGGDPKDKQFQDSLVEYFISKNICNSYYWDWNPNSTDTGGVLKDDWTTVWDNKVALLQRYFSSCQNSSAPVLESTLIKNPPSTTTVSETSPGTIIEIEAAGTEAGGEYPTIDLVVGGSVVKTFTNVQGNPDQNSYVKLRYLHPTKLINTADISIKYTNDQVIGGRDRNLKVDKIVVDNTIFDTSSKTTYSEGSWDAVNGCKPGFKQSKWLHCNGSFRWTIDKRTASDPLPPPSPSPSPSPAPSPISLQPESDLGYRVAFYNNKNLSGSPSLVESMQTISANWHANAPNPFVGSDNFSLRATGTTYFAAGTYRFHTLSDDGVRVYIDNEMLIDQWNDHAATDHEAFKVLSEGNHDVRVEYYENGGNAVLEFGYEKIGELATQASQPSTSVTIYAAGTPAGGIYPTMQVKINDQAVALFERVAGNPITRSFHALRFETNLPVSGMIQLEYLNDQQVGTEDRNLVIDKVVVGETVYEIERPNVFSIGSWSSSNGCGEGFKQSEWLHCTGHVTFSL